MSNPSTASTAAFWNSLAKKYAARPVGDPAAYAETLDRVRAHLAPGAKVLEVGCGTGSTAILLAPAVAAYTATDVATKMLTIAQAKPEASGLPNLTFLEADTLSAPEGPFDAVLAFSLLHLVPDLRESLAALHARLAPNGLLISKTVCLAELGAWLRVLIPAMRAVGLAPPVWFLKRAELQQAIRDAGFEIVETGDYPEKRAAHFIVARKI